MINNGKNKEFSIPNLFIVGAPRSGTTALMGYLDDHPEICASAIPEPNFFNTDFSSELCKFEKHEDYLRECFGDCKPDVSYIGEKTVWYLSSTEAAENILELNSNAKFIVSVRNPIELAYSLHGKLFEVQQEDEQDFETAWRLQEARARGEQIPVGCPDPQILQYGRMGKLGTQLSRLFETVPREQVHVIIFDDFVSDTRGTYEKTLEFLDVEADERSKFVPTNGARRPRFPKLQYWLRQGSKRLYAPFYGILERFKKLLGIRRFHFTYWLSRLNLTDRKRVPLNPALRLELIEYYRNEVKKISELLERDLSHWLFTQSETTNRSSEEKED